MLVFVRKGSYMLKKNLGCLVVSSLALLPIQARADLYQECLDKNYMSDRDMASCNNDEATRIMGEIRKKMNSIASTGYFNNWSPSKKGFQEILQNWENLRDQYCDLYGYAYTQGMGTISVLNTSQCKVDMNQRFLTDLDNIINVYKENAM